MKRKLFLNLLLTTLLPACAIGPDYQRPALEIPGSYKENADWKIAAPQDGIEQGKWWELFGDRELNGLIEQIDVSNQNLKVAEARYRQALALTQSARANLLPNISVNASSTRSRGVAARSGSENTIGTSHNASLSLGWEIDLWGKISRQVESNEAAALASAADVQAARLSLQAELAINYFQLRVSDKQKQLLEETVSAYEKSLELTKNRYAVGVAGRSDIVQAETQLLSARAQLIDLGVQRAQLEHAIAVLVGRPPSVFSLPLLKWTAVAPVIPARVPSHLLERRPDIAAAERRVVAANAQIGVAQAAYFPSLTLSGSLGYTSSTLAKWLTAPNRFWSLGPALAEALFDFGRRAALTDQTIAIYEQNVAGYRQTVLEGLQEVEDNLAALRLLEQEAVVQDQAIRAARESVLLTANQYKAGTVSYLSVVTVQAAQYSNERTAVNLLGRRLIAAVGLIKGLGGAWENAALATAKF